MEVYVTTLTKFIKQVKKKLIGHQFFCDPQIFFATPTLRNTGLGLKKEFKNQQKLK